MPVIFICGNILGPFNPIDQNIVNEPIPAKLLLIQRNNYNLNWKLTFRENF